MQPQTKFTDQARPLIPIDDVTQTMNELVWRLGLDEARSLEDVFDLDPFARIMKYMALAGAVAKRDESFRLVLARPGVLPTLKAMAVSRKNIQDERESERLGNASSTAPA